MNAPSLVGENAHPLCDSNNHTKDTRDRSFEMAASPASIVMVKSEEATATEWIATNMETVAMENDFEDATAHRKTPQLHDDDDDGDCDTGKRVAGASLATVVAKWMTSTAESQAPGENETTSNGAANGAAPTLPMSGIADPLDGDILLGRGAAKNRHPGNRKYRHLVNSNRPFYATCGRDDKLKVVASIHKALRADGCRFLEQESSTKLWRDVGDKRATDKIAQALREGQQLLKQKLTELLGHKEQTPAAVTPTTPTKVLSSVKSEDGELASPPLLPNLMERRKSAPEVSNGAQLLKKSQIRRALSVDGASVRSSKKRKSCSPRASSVKKEEEAFSNKVQDEQHVEPLPIDALHPYSMEVKDNKPGGLIGIEDLEDFDFEPLPAVPIPSRKSPPFLPPPMSTEPNFVPSVYQKKWPLPIRLKAVDAMLGAKTKPAPSFAFTSSPSFGGESTADSVSGVAVPSTTTVVTDDGSAQDSGSAHHGEEEEIGVSHGKTSRTKRRRTSECSDGASTLTTVMIGCDDVFLSDDEEGEHGDLVDIDTDPLGIDEDNNAIIDYVADDDGVDDLSGDPFQEILKNMEIFQTRAREQLMSSASSSSASSSSASSWAAKTETRTTESEVSPDLPSLSQFGDFDNDDAPLATMEV